MRITVLFTLIATALAAPIERRGVVSNDLLNGPCKAITVVFARGTTEPGNIGDVVGPQLDYFLNSRLGNNIAFQGVDYPASIAGFLIGGSPEGADTLASLVNTAATKCPSTQIVLSGYSQGAQVVYKGAAKLSNELAGKIRAAVLFGNPDNGQAIPNINNANAKTFCHAGDTICDGTAIVLPAHLTYGLDAPAAADFIAGRISL